MESTKIWICRPDWIAVWYQPRGGVGSTVEIVEIMYSRRWRKAFFAKFSLEHDALQEREYVCAVFLLFETWSVFGCVMNQEKIYTKRIGMCLYV